MQEHFNQKTVVFDFDGVIHDYSNGWQGATVITGNIVRGIPELLEELYKAGYNIVIQSSRAGEDGGTEAIIDWCFDKGIMRYIELITAKKVPAVVYIDDRGITFDPKDIDSLYNTIVNFEPWNRR